MNNNFIDLRVAFSEEKVSRTKEGNAVLMKLLQTSKQLRKTLNHKQEILFEKYMNAIYDECILYSNAAYSQGFNDAVLVMGQEV